MRVTALDIQWHLPVSGSNPHMLSWHPDGQKSKCTMCKYISIIILKMETELQKILDSLLSGSEAALPPDEAAPTHSFWISLQAVTCSHITL